MGISNSSLNVKINIHDNTSGTSADVRNTSVVEVAQDIEGNSHACYFYPGNVVRGEVIIDVRSPVALGAGTVSLVAEERVRATAGVIAGQATYTQTHSKVTSFYKETLVLFGPSSTDRTENIHQRKYNRSRSDQDEGDVAGPGCYRFPFRFYLPLELPSGTNRLSSRSQRISVNYYVHAKLFKSEKIPPFLLHSNSSATGSTRRESGLSEGGGSESQSELSGRFYGLLEEEESQEEPSDDADTNFECQREIMVIVPISMYRMLSERGFANQKRLPLYRSSGGGGSKPDGGHVVMTLGTERRFFSGGGDTVMARIRIDNSQGRVKIDHIKIECYPKVDFIVPDYTDSNFNSKRGKNHLRSSSYPRQTMSQVSSASNLLTGSQSNLGEGYHNRPGSRQSTQEVPDQISEASLSSPTTTDPRIRKPHFKTPSDSPDKRTDIDSPTGGSGDASWKTYEGSSRPIVTSCAHSERPAGGVPRLPTVPSLSALAEVSFAPKYGQMSSSKHVKRTLSHVQGPSLIQLKLQVDVPAGAGDITIPFSVPLPHYIDVSSYPSQGFSHTFRHELSISIPSSRETVSVPLYVAKAAYTVDHPDLPNAHATDGDDPRSGEQSCHGNSDAFDDLEEGSPFPFIPNNICIFGIPQHRVFNSSNERRSDTSDRSSSLYSRPLSEHLDFQPDEEDNECMITPAPLLSADGCHKPLSLAPVTDFYSFRRA